MLFTDILHADLNAQIEYVRFFHALGYSDSDIVYLRSFDDKKQGGIPQNSQVELSRIDAALPMLRNRNNDDMGIFFVVNGDGQRDRDVKHARAQFIDIDDGTLEEQLSRLSGFALEPSIIIKTRKSLHAYWLLKDGDIKAFREIQQRLIQYFGSDPSIINESRVMRLYGFEHRKADPVMVTLIKFDPDMRYTQGQLHEALPLLERKTREATHTPGRDGEKIPVGQRYNYMISRIGELLNRLGDSASDGMILAALEADLFEHCESPEDVDMEDFRQRYLRDIQKIRAKHEAENNDPEFFSFARKAWMNENPGKPFDVEGIGWDEVRAAGERAKAAGWLPAEEGTDTPPSQSTQKRFDISLQNVNETDETSVDWLIGNYIPKDNITILCGDGGTGKTMIWCELAAAISNGTLPPFMQSVASKGNPFEDRRTVIYFSAEDDTGTVLRARLRKAGADLHNIYYLGAESENFQKIKFVSDELTALIEKYRPALCIFDPLQSFLDDNVRMGERNAMRSRLDPLAGLAARTQTTMLILMHTNKREGAYGRNRMADSSDIWDRARSVLIAGKADQEGIYYLSHEKCNYGRLGDTILYRITDDGIEFAGTSTKKDADYVRAQAYTKKDVPKREDAKQMLLDELADGERLVSDIDDFILNVMNVSKETLKRAKKELVEEKKISIWKTGNPQAKNQRWHISLRGGQNVT